MRAGLGGVGGDVGADAGTGAAMPRETVDVSVDGEWSFAQTLRHLVFATDVWLGARSWGSRMPSIRSGCRSPGWREQAAGVGIDLDATPSYERGAAGARRTGRPGPRFLGDRLRRNDSVSNGRARSSPARAVPGRAVPVDHHERGVAPPPLRRPRPGCDRGQRPEHADELLSGLLRVKTRTDHSRSTDYGRRAPGGDVRPSGGPHQRAPPTPAGRPAPPTPTPSPPPT